MLKTFAETLRQCVRECDTVSRLGGDEFSILLPELSCAEEAEQVAEKILDTFRVPWTVLGYTLNMSSSIGVAFFPENGEDVETLLKKADMALLEAKKTARNHDQQASGGFNERL